MRVPGARVAAARFTATLALQPTRRVGDNLAGARRHRAIWCRVAELENRPVLAEP